jgi:hypothetical protein
MNIRSRILDLMFEREVTRDTLEKASHLITLALQEPEPVPNRYVLDEYYVVSLTYGGTLKLVRTKQRSNADLRVKTEWTPRHGCRLLSVEPAGSDQ